MPFYMVLYDIDWLMAISINYNDNTDIYNQRK